MIVTSQSFRGGVGKSTITLNLALQLAMQDYKVSLVDLDIFAPSLHHYFLQDPRSVAYCINDYLLENCDLSQVRQNVAVKKGNIDFYPASIELKKLSQTFENGYDLQRLVQGIQELDQASDIVLIDNHSSVTEEAIGVLSITDLTLLYTSPDISSMEGIFMWRDVLDRFNLDENQVIMVLNKVLAAKQDINKIQVLLEQGAKRKADYVFFYHDEVALASSKDTKPMCLSYPKSVYAKSIKELSRDIAARM